jgi:hypothetical protein
MTAGGVSQAPAATSWAVAKSLACQKIAEGPCEGSFSCWIRVSNVPFVRPSWRHLVKSCHLRLYFVWSSAPSDSFRLTKTIRRKQDAARLSQEGNTTTWSPRNAVVWPSYYSTMTSRWDHGVGVDSRIWVAQAFPHVSWLRGHIKGQPQSVFLSQSWATLQSRDVCNSHNHNSVPAEWHTLMMRQPGKRRQQHCFFWCTSENMMSNYYKPSTSSYR